MRVKILAVYEFSELSIHVQKKVTERYTNKLLDLLDDDLKDIMKMEFNNHMHNLDFELAYSLNCCQGDGVSFTGSVDRKEDLFVLASLVYGGDKIPRNISRLINCDIIYKVEFARCNYRYTHGYTVQTSIIDNYNISSRYHYISRTINEFQNDINKWRLKTCDILEKEGYKAIDNLCSDDNIKSYLIENDCEFFLDGSDYNY